MKSLGEHAIKSVLITGCNRGIGLEFVSYFSKFSDMQVFACSRRVSEALSEMGKLENVHLVPMEITSDESVNAAVSQVTEKLNGAGLNLLINNAAIVCDNVYIKVSETTPEEMNKLYDVNVASQHRVTTAFYPLLKVAAAAKSDLPLCSARAAIINFSSITASLELTPFFGRVMAFPYAITKCAVNMLTKCTAFEYKDDGIMCVAVHPGWVDTDMGAAGGGKGETSAAQSVEDLCAIIREIKEEHNGAYLEKGMKKIPF